MSVGEALRNSSNHSNTTEGVTTNTTKSDIKTSHNVAVSTEIKDEIAHSTKTDTALEQRLKCDYLVVGAGTTGMSFVDTILTENSKATIILVDKNNNPGGHWTKAYDFVQLHQPSCTYGVNSLPLGKNRFGRERWDLDDRASKSEILNYYQTVLEKFQATGRVRSFFGATYEYNECRNVHTIRFGTRGSTGDADKDSMNTMNTKRTAITVEITCRKVVTSGASIITPSMREPLIPVHETIASNFVPVNEVTSRIASGRYKKYIIFGNGKTSIDAITHMLGDNDIDPSQITWITSREAWFLVTEPFRVVHKSMRTIANRVLSSKSVKETFLGLEKDGLMARIDDSLDTFPEVFRRASVNRKQLEQVRFIKNIVRLGKATSIGPHTIHLERGSLDFSVPDTLLVDCMVDNSYGYASFDNSFQTFEPNRINLGPLFGFLNISLSAAIVAFLECSFGDTTRNGETEETILRKQNDCCWLLTGDCACSPESLVGMLYMEAKYTEALMKTVPGAIKFLMQSRLNMNAPMHHKHGTLKLLWNMIGPPQLYKFPQKLIQKVESGGYTDIDHCFGAETHHHAVNESVATKTSSSMLVANEEHNTARINKINNFHNTGKSYETLVLSCN